MLPQMQIGETRVTALSAGRVRMDGGAMFGVVPKPLWSKRIAPDDRNRIDLDMRCLLVETGGETVLVETGFGGKASDKLREIYDLREDPGLLDGLRRAGKSASDVDTVVLTHLHQDHAGGTTVRDGTGYRPTFPRARYVVQAGEWRDAREADAQTANAYRREEVLDPLERSGQVDLVEGDTDLSAGIRLLRTPGHTRDHQSVMISSGDETLVYVGDLVPTASHLKPIYVMAYDLYPRETFVNKTRLLEEAGREGWWVMWPHDPEIVWGRIEPDARDGFRAVRTATVP